jgi:Toprim domain/CHC2 zinc finger
MIADADIERARAVSIENEVARRGVKLRRAGAELFAVNIRKQIFNCRQCGVGGDVIKLVQHIDACDFATAISTLAGNTARATPRPAPTRRPVHAREQRPLKSNNNFATRRDDDDDDQRRLKQADEIWRASAPLGSDAVIYFLKRGISINDVPGHGGLRYHSRCPWGAGTAPAIVGRFTTAIGNEPRGIWRRPLTGEKPMSLGPMAGCVIRLWPDEVVEQGLVVGEGVETTLAAATRIQHKGTMLRPAWAVCSAGNLERLPVLSGIEALTILVDHDASGRGQEAAAACAARWSAAGREVIRLTPKIVGADFNDVVRV